ncbi:uncharacterized protein LOC113377677 isoform X2 [Ctenocephalides felis]|uniref:uncharacterized protein LOC113377677 isoform X2 n=1 Tax=Ctenocephalides felis TaxID=7515 RepID=UPI000E6E114A|nr:uncharacterized protein LOC113377677 isoform X2 [Ctenocephalides felis]
MDDFNLLLELPCPDKRIAEILYEVLMIDAEPSRSTVKKKFTLENNVIKVRCSSPNVKNLRVAVNGLFDNFYLVLQTIDTFGPANPTYDYYFADLIASK